MAAKIFRINYKSDFILTLNSDAGWMTPFCIKFWTGAPSQAFFVGWDGETYTHCAYDPSEPTKLLVQFDDHHLPIGDLKFQIAYHFTVADFPNDTEDEVINPANITTEIDGETYQVMLDFTGETAPEIEFSLPAYANEAQRIANEQQRIAAETQRISNEETRINNEQARVAQEQTRQQNEAQRIAQESARVSEFASLKSASEAATRDANNAATLANEKAQLADDKAALADNAATQASLNALYAHDEGQLAGQKAFEADQATQLATNEASFAHDEGNYAKQQGDYAKEQGDTALADHVRANADHSTAVDDHTQANNDHTRAESDHSTSAADHTTAGNDHTRAESDHGIAADDHTQAGNDHTRAESDHGIAADDHTTAGNDHTRAESDHTRAESDHAAVEVYVDSLGAFDISAYHATGGVLAEYADLTAALGTNGANIPDALRKGGMSVKFVSSSDHKYVQYRCIADEFTTDTTQWAVCDDSIYVENPEFIRVVTDKDGRILACIKTDGSIEWAVGVPKPVREYVEVGLDTKVDKKENKSLIDEDFANGISYIENPEFICVSLDSENKVLFGVQKDGNFLFGAGVPRQVIKYIESRIADLSLDEYEDIVAFLNDLEKGDKTLQTLLNEKVDKEEGKSLIDSEYADGVHYIDNSEFVYVKTDSEDKILFGIKVDGEPYFGVGCPKQVKEYVKQKIVDLSLDEYEDIVTFLSEYLGGDTTLKSIIGEWNNAATGKKISILGDSISTFNQEGYKIDGYAMYYPTAAGDRGADVTTVNDTWWMQVINNIEGVLEVNASYSGSTASSRAVGFSPRVPLLGNPDIIYIALGTNDSSNGVTVGEINFEAETYDLTQFAPAYIKGMQDTIAAYPKAKIVCVAFDMGADYQNAIKTIAEHYSAEYIYVGDISDVHPNKAEMTAAANRIIPSAKYTITDAIKTLSKDKVDKEVGKSLIDAEYADGVSQIENPEFAEVHTDTDDKILYGVKQDGDFYFGAGVPSQIQEEIAKVAINKVDKEEGKSLIDADYASTKSTIDNPEFLDVTLDAEDKVLEGIQQDGTKVISGDLNVGGSSNINGDIRVLGDMEVSGVSYKVIENPEYLVAWVDAEDKVIFGLNADGKTYVGDADFLDDIENIKAFLANFNDKDIDWDALSSITAIDNPEYISVETDSEEKILGGRKIDGTKVENVGFETPKISIDKFSIKNINDTEGRLEVKIDKNNKVLSYRKSDGTLVENVGIEIPKLKLTGNGLNELGEELKKGGYANLMDWSNETFIHIPMPDFAVVNFICDKKKENITAKSGLGTAGVNCEIPAYMEFWDKSGNYFKKPVEISAQGSSSMNYYIKNNAIDITDGSEIKFGNLIAQDSFHLKKYYQDVFRGQCIVAYHLMEQIYKTRPAGECRPWDYLNISTAAFGSGNLNADFNNAALAHPDGFPFKMYWNGEYSGVYCFNLKKHRANYNMKKNEYKKIILDGEIGIDEFWGGTIDWTAFEIRNPKDLYYAPYDQLSAITKTQIDNGHISKYKTVDNVRYYKYDGDYPDILTDNTNVDNGVSAFVRGSIERLAGSVLSIDAASTTEGKKTLFNKYFIKDFFIDYVVASEVLYHWDGFRKNWIWCIWDADYDSENEEFTGHWTPTLYDCDSIFGITFNGTEFINTDGTGYVSKGFGRQPALVCNELYNSDIYTRYSELVSAGIFTVNNIIGLMNSWLGRIGYENFEEEVSYVESLSCEIPSYRDGSLTYSRYPTQGGCYNSIKRVTEWLKLRLPWLTSNLNQ